MAYQSLNCYGSDCNRTEPAFLAVQSRINDIAKANSEKFAFGLDQDDEFQSQYRFFNYIDGLVLKNNNLHISFRLTDGDETQCKIISLVNARSEPICTSSTTTLRQALTNITKRLDTNPAEGVVAYLIQEPNMFSQILFAHVGANAWPYMFQDPADSPRTHPDFFMGKDKESKSCGDRTVTLFYHPADIADVLGKQMTAFKRTYNAKLKEAFDQRRKDLADANSIIASIRESQSNLKPTKAKKK